MAGILRPLISELTPQSTANTFKEQVNQLINDARLGFTDAIDMSDTQKQPIQETIQLIPTRPTPLNQTYDHHPHNDNRVSLNNEVNKSYINSIANVSLNDDLTKFITSKQKQSVSALTVKQLNQRIGYFIERTHLAEVGDVTSSQPMEYKDCLLEESRKTT